LDCSIASEHCQVSLRISKQQCFHQKWSKFNKHWLQENISISCIIASPVTSFFAEHFSTLFSNFSHKNLIGMQ